MEHSRMFQKRFQKVPKSARTFCSIRYLFLKIACKIDVTYEFGLSQRKRMNRKYQCETCKKELTSRYGFKCHQKIHTGERLFTCDDCKRSFIRKQHLINHLRIHTGEKPFTCEDCKRSFTQKHHLIDHLRIHTGEKPFSCNYCTHKFTFRSHLYDHIMRHHNNNRE
ncbi:gastrula zinc finger protein XlCGF8.2DB-like isoform X3 [Centruroides sculpturatus]|uniref:gastrula zinc finger protein XlCGF8.2DB-like isoform X3 n=1 Tax=Centruroides sculpturatus TaxID=218467 RepID=UPI000C6CD8F3|nr:gastrula zinc finger protein XlCGF8.2DB-like isoform X3 [Centruroides sculpturatus]